MSVKITKFVNLMLWLVVVQFVIGVILDAYITQGERKDFDEALKEVSDNVLAWVILIIAFQH